jgi:hypothetical protein
VKQGSAGPIARFWQRCGGTPRNEGKCHSEPSLERIPAEGKFEYPQIDALISFSECISEVSGFSILIEEDFS